MNVISRLIPLHSAAASSIDNLNVSGLLRFFQGYDRNAKSIFVVLFVLLVSYVVSFGPSCLFSSASKVHFALMVNDGFLDTGIDACFV